MKNFYLKISLFSICGFIFIVGASLIINIFMDISNSFNYILLLLSLLTMQSFTGLILYATKDKGVSLEFDEEVDELLDKDIPVSKAVELITETKIAESADDELEIEDDIDMLLSKEPKQKREVKKKKRSVILLISAILGVIYSVYLVIYSSGAFNSSDGVEQVGVAITIYIIMPHMVAVTLASIMNMFGWAMNSRWLTLTGAILYTVSIVLFPIYFIFVIIQMILSFVGFAKLLKEAKK